MYHCSTCGSAENIRAVDLTDERLRETGSEKKCAKCGQTMMLITPRRFRGKWMTPRLLVRDLVALEEKRSWDDKDMGRTVFDPRLVLLENERSREPLFWTPYWITVQGKSKYGQFAPMVKERELLELLTKAIKKRWFSEEFRTVLMEALGAAR